MGRVANHEGSLVSFPGASGWFTHTLGIIAGAPGAVGGALASTLNYGTPFPNSSGIIGGPGGDGVIIPGTTLINSGVIIAQAIQSVSIVENTVAEPVLVIGHTGNAGFSKRAGTVDVTIEAVLTSGLPLGKTLLDYEETFPGNLTVDTTDGANLGAFGRRAVVSGLALNSLTFTFTQNANSTVAAGFVGDGVTWFPLTSPQGMDTDIEHIPLTWDTISVSGVRNGREVRMSGVQNVTFAGTMTRDLVYEIGSFLPIHKPSQRPHTVNVTLSALSDDVVLVDYLNMFQTDFDAGDPNNLFVVKMGAQGHLGGRRENLGGRGVEWIIASGLRPVSATMSQSVGANSTIELSFTGSSLRF